MSPERTLIRGPRVLTGDRLQELDLVLSDGQIEALVAPGAEQASTSIDTVIEANGRWVLPGAIDVHVHFREPGLEHKEEFASGTLAAAAGGVTTVFDMPNTKPVVQTAEVLLAKADLVGRKARVDFGLYAVLDETSLHHLEDLAKAGAAGFKLFLGPTTGNIYAPSTGKLLNAFGRIAELGLPVFVHAEDRDIIEEREAEGELRDYATFVKSRPPIAEALAIDLVGALSRETGCRVHIAHVSSRSGVEAVARAKASGAALTAETCPHYLFLTEGDWDQVGAEMKVVPPIRSEDDQEALWHGLRDGTLDLVSSDHAAHSAEEKAASSFALIPGGGHGVETLYPTMLDAALSGVCSLEDVVKWVCRRPSEVFGIGARKGSIGVGRDADIVVFDPKGRRTVERSTLHAKVPNSPFIGRVLQGAVDKVLVRGRQVWPADESEPVGSWLKSPTRRRMEGIA